MRYRFTLPSLTTLRCYRSLIRCCWLLHDCYRYVRFCSYLDYIWVFTTVLFDYSFTFPHVLPIWISTISPYGVLQVRSTFRFVLPILYLFFLRFPSITHYLMPLSFILHRWHFFVLFGGTIHFVQISPTFFCVHHLDFSASPPLFVTYRFLPCCRYRYYVWYSTRFTAILHTIL